MSQAPQQTPRDAAMAEFDTLAPVSVASMLGAWSGAEIPTGHPMDGLLEASRWHGKRFDDPDTVHPLVHTTAAGVRYSIHPQRLPLGMVMSAPWMKRLVSPALITLLRPLLQTTRPAARLRAIEHRGLVTAAMVYDHLPIIDHFRERDDDNIMGVMDFRGWPPYFFSLTREAP